MSLGERNLSLNFCLSKIDRRAWKESFGEGLRSTQSEVGILRLRECFASRSTHFAQDDKTGSHLGFSRAVLFPKAMPFLELVIFYIQKSDLRPTGSATHISQRKRDVGHPANGSVRPTRSYTPLGRWRINDKNSERVSCESRKEPSIEEVTAAECCFSTPRIIMHRWRASITTPTPCGLMAS